MPPRKSPCCESFSTDNLEELRNPDDKYGRVKLICASCKKHYKFDTSDKNKKILEDRQRLIGRITSSEEFCNTLSMKQRGFLNDLYDARSPTLAQLNYLNSLAEKNARWLKDHPERDE